VRKEEQICSTKVKYKNDNERYRPEIGEKHFQTEGTKERKLGKESLNEPRKSSRYEKRQADR